MYLFFILLLAFQITKSRSAAVAVGTDSLTSHKDEALKITLAETHDSFKTSNLSKLSNSSNILIIGDPNWCQNNIVPPRAGLIYRPMYAHCIPGTLQQYLVFCDWEGRGIAGGPIVEKSCPPTTMCFQYDGFLRWDGKYDSDISCWGMENFIKWIILGRSYPDDPEPSPDKQPVYNKEPVAKKAKIGNRVRACSPPLSYKGSRNAVVLGARWIGADGSAVKVDGWFDIDGELSKTTANTHSILMETTFPNPVKIIVCAILGFKLAKEDVEGYAFIRPPLDKIYHWYDSIGHRPPK